MTNHAVGATCDALRFATTGTGRSFGDASTEIAEGTVLLGPLAEITGNGEVTGVLAEVDVVLLLGDGLLTSSLLLGFLASSSLSFGHGDGEGSYQ